ncbi:MAG: hypothetical protein P3X24_007815, partial [bacterium]|nr:hypothetical protein [bacterium]
VGRRSLHIQVQARCVGVAWTFLSTRVWSAWLGHSCPSVFCRRSLDIPVQACFVGVDADDTAGHGLESPCYE